MDQVKACLFDLDGVIVDTARYHYRAWRRLAKELGFDFSEAQNEQLKGVSRLRSLELVLGWGGLVKTEGEKAALASRKNDWYVELVSQMQPGEVLAGALAFLQALRAAGIPTALASASKNAGTILERVGLLPFFDAVVDGNQVQASKPDPEVFLKCAQALSVPPQACVVFEDAQAGIAAAKAAGMKVVGIGSPQVLSGADLVVAGLHDMTLEKLKSL